MKNSTMTLVQAVRLVDHAESLFNRAAKAWVRGNNSASTDWGRRNLTRCNALCDKLRGEAEALLLPLGIVTDYPGLYPSFNVKGYCEYSVLNAVSSALDDSKPLKAAGIPTDNHESDLYFATSRESLDILNRHPLQESIATQFRSQIDGKLWMEVPFAFIPFWESKAGAA